MSRVNNTTAIGAKEIDRLQREGWKFAGGGIRVANGWMVWCENPQGGLEVKVLADPDDHPELYPADAPATTPGGFQQTELL